MEQVICNLCGSSETETLYDLPDRLLFRNDVRVHLVRCCQCGLIYQNPRPVLQAMAKHYPAEYELYAPEPDGEKTSWLLRQAYRYGMEKRRRFVTAHKHTGRLLDVGCATGLFLRAMQSAPGWELYGVDISPHAVRIARETYHLNVMEGTLEAPHFSDSFFDVVTMWDVFEHLHDPARSLQEIFRILRPDGVLVLRVPNGGGWDAQVFRSYWAGLEPPRHLYVFTPRTLQAVLERNRFEVIRRTTLSGAYTTFLLSLKFWLRDGLGARADRLVDMFYHPFWRLVTAPIFSLTSLGLRGPQLVVTARKKA